MIYIYANVRKTKTGIDPNLIGFKNFLIKNKIKHKIISRPGTASLRFLKKIERSNIDLENSIFLNYLFCRKFIISLITNGFKIRKAAFEGWSNLLKNTNQKVICLYHLLQRFPSS